MVLKAAGNIEHLQTTLLYRRVLVTLISHRQKVTQMFLRQSLGIRAVVADFVLCHLIKQETVNSEHMVDFTKLWSTAVPRFLGRKKAKRGRNGQAWVMCATSLMVVVVSVIVIILTSA